VVRGEGAHSYPVTAGVTRKVRITLLSLVVGRTDGNVGISELKIPGAEPQRALEVPADLPAGAAPGYAFTRGAQPRYACVPDGEHVRCDPSAARDGEEPDGIRRLFSTTSQSAYEFGGTVLPAGGGRVPVALPGVQVTGTSQLGGDPVAGAFAAVDGNPATAWLPDVTDLRPTLTLDWAEPRTISGIRVATDPGGTARAPARLELTTPTSSRSVELDASGAATFPPLDTSQLKIAFAGLDDDQRTRNSLGIGSLSLTGAELPVAPTEFALPCGSGPNVHLDGLDYDTSVRGTLADFVAHRPLTLSACPDSQGGVDLAAGGHELRTERSESFVVQDLWLKPAGKALAPAAHRAISVDTWDATARSVTVAGGDESILAVPENANAGWTASLNGTPLAKTRVDGWQQAWILPAGSGGVVRLEFTPDWKYRSGLLIGAIAILAVLIGVLWPVRRRRVSVEEGSGIAVPVVLIGLLAVLGGMLPIVLLIAVLLARQFSERAPRYLAFGGMAVGTLVAVVGRLLGHGQEWAYGPVTQASLLLAASAMVAMCLPWFVGRSPDPDVGPGS
jgi:arabinofuranan 3-O-arabinosyltransferase